MSASVTDELAALAIFTAVEPTQLHDLARRAIAKRLAPGQVLFTEGDPSAHLVLVRSGRVRVLVSSERGDELVLTVLGAGDAFGELSVLDGLPRSATAEALDAAEVVLLPADAVRAVLDAHPAALLAVTQQLAAQVRRITGSAADLVFLDLPRRLAKLVLARANGTATAELGVSQSGLAAQLGTTRQSVNKALSGLTTRGWISTSGTVVTVLDEAALRRFSAS
ncbi:MAG TPA: Crp/Fnr family transcriptional regulator [Jatrophihabitans sp.]|jgi:CRP-like cAMP-binding protein